MLTSTLLITSPKVRVRIRSDVGRKRIRRTGSAKATPILGNLELYIRDINATPLLTVAEERDLAKKIADTVVEITPEHGHSPAYLAAYGLMVRANLRLVVKMAKRYTRCGVPFCDLVQDGNTGLMTAAERFDFTKGAKFSTYASYWIKQAILAGIAANGRLIRVKFRPSEGGATLKRWHQARRSLTLANASGDTPSDEEIARSLGITPKQAETIVQAIRMRDISRFDDGDPLRVIPLEELLIASDDAGSPFVEDVASVFKHLDLLTKIGAVDGRAAEILRLHFGLGEQKPMTLAAIGKRLGITREWVRKIELKAMTLLQTELAGSLA